MNFYNEDLKESNTNTRICLAWDKAEEDVLYVEYDRYNNEIVRRQRCGVEELGKVLEIFMNHYNLDVLELDGLLITKSPVIE